jgi:acetyl esterase/lipase
MPYDIPTHSGEQDLIYKRVGERELPLIFLPPTHKNYDRDPVYFIITGGGWHAGSARGMLGFSRASVDALRARGWAVASIEYRLTGEGATIDDIISDCMDAGRYLRRFENELGIDMSRVYVSGHSAGAHLALMVSHAPHADFCADSPFDAVADDFTVLGCAPLSPITYLYALDGASPVNFDFDRLFKDSVYDLDAAHRASPLDYINAASVPTLIVCGTHDTLVYPDNSTRFYDRSRALGAPCEIICSERGGHCFESMVKDEPSCPNMLDVQLEIVAFARQFE